MELQKTNLITQCPNTWCPGCGNFGILAAFKQAIEKMISQGTKREDIVVVGDIGCNSKIADYLNLNSFIGLHGRPVTTAEGVKLANPNLKVFVFTGDGGSLNEGLDHLIHAAKRNSNIKVIMHNNRLFALTTGQFTAVSPKGMKGRSTPQGTIEEPFSPLELMVASNASFIARSYSAKMEHMANVFLEADKHNGFAFIEILQPCVSFFNPIQFYNERIYEAENKAIESEEETLKLAREWNYSESGKIPLGIFYKKERPVFEESARELIGKNIEIEKCLEAHY
ncbi:MAG: thiamine pyrophosphate-dependent enzyme [Candidatus Pacebacteria bacterium]|nr:thiamine pyrophosphate-dependent enzyme [Candidatus Paceibacterota bacterium]